MAYRTRPCMFGGHCWAMPWLVGVSCWAVSGCLFPCHSLSLFLMWQSTHPTLLEKDASQDDWTWKIMFEGLRNTRCPIEQGKVSTCCSIADEKFMPCASAGARYWNMHVPNAMAADVTVLGAGVKGDEAWWIWKWWEMFAKYWNIMKGRVRNVTWRYLKENCIFGALQTSKMTMC